MADGDVGNALRDTVASLVNVLKSSNELVPGAVVVAGVLGAAVIYVCAHFGGLRLGVTALTVFVVSLAIYASRSSFGDAALGLAAGIFAAFAVNWDGTKFIVFEFLWLAFGLYVLLLASLKLAGRSQEIYLQAAEAMGVENVEEVQRRLKTMRRDAEAPTLGPIERAEVLRHFAFRQMPLDAMPANLRSVAILSVITRVDHMRTASYAADMWAMLKRGTDPAEDVLRGKMLSAIRNSGTSPDEFLACFFASRRLVLVEGMDAELYLATLQQATAGGVPSSEMHEHLKVTWRAL